jgi:inorganic pyrophosphatase
MSVDYLSLEPCGENSGVLSVVIETPKGSRNKFDYEPERGVFKLGGVLTAGAVFPYDFGFVPQTLGEDGDPLDVLVLMDEPAFPGCVVDVRVIGVIEANQTERDGQTMRNDRFLTVSTASHLYQDLEKLDDLATNLLNEIEHFFASYNEIKGKKFTPLARSEAERANELIVAGRKAFAQSK